MLTNSFNWSSGVVSSNGLADPAGTVVAVVEPNLAFAQTVSETCAYLGSPIVYTLTVHPSASSLSTAYNVGLSDQLPQFIGATGISPLTMQNVVVTNSAGMDLSSRFTLSNGLLSTTNGSTLMLASNDTLTIIVYGEVLVSSSAGNCSNLAMLTYSSRNGDYTTNSGFNPNPWLTSDQERVYTASNSAVFTLNINGIGGYVYADTNNNGVKDAGEPGVGGVPVSLFGINSLGQFINETTTTAADGSYAFSGLVPGDYDLARATLPSGYFDGRETPGTPFGGSGTNAVISGIAITGCASAAGVNYNFGLVQPNSLGGVVFADLNRNGIMDGTDYPITNVLVTLTGTNDLGVTIDNSAETSTNGSYLFAALRPGTYQITETQPVGYGQGTNAVGTTGGTNSAQDVISRIVLTQNQNGVNYDFGETLASIGNFVWNDVNADGVRQAAERGLGNVMVYVDLNSSGHYMVGDPSAITDTNGYYLITNMLAGNYTVAVATNTLPAGSVETYDLDGTNSPNKVASLLLLAGTNRLDVNFGYRYVSPTLAVLQAGTFRGFATNGGVMLVWNTLSEVDVAYYLVNRQTAAGWETVGYAMALNSPSGGAYNALDESVSGSGDYQYQLVEEQMDGTDSIIGYCDVTVGPILIGLTIEGGNVRLQWSGGMPPYHLYQATTLAPAASGVVPSVAGVSGSSWSELSLPDCQTNTTLVPIGEGQRFYRLSGQ